MRGERAIIIRAILSGQRRRINVGWPPSNRDRRAALYNWRPASRACNPHHQRHS